MARNRLATELHVIHCSATQAKADIGAADIHKWHVKRGIFSDRGRTGYHFVIRRDGTVELGRELLETGAHALGFNDESIGTCLVGGVDKDLQPEDNFTVSQWMSLRSTCAFVRCIWPTILTTAHHALTDRKACPSFNVYERMFEFFGYDDEALVLKYLAEEERDRY
jgi:hypothetical protein